MPELSLRASRPSHGFVRAPGRASLPGESRPLGESVGLGFLIRDAGTQFLPEQALSVILFLGIVGYILDRLVVAATNVLCFWQQRAEI